MQTMSSVGTTVLIRWGRNGAARNVYQAAQAFALMIEKTIGARVARPIDLMAAIAVSLLLIVVCNFATAQSTLPPAVQADILKAQIFEALKKKDFKLVLSEMDKYHKLERQGIEVPVPLLFYEAKAASETGDLARAHDVLEAYLKRATSADRNYAEAIRWYPALTASEPIRARALSVETQKRQKVNSLNTELSEANRQVLEKRRECNSLSERYVDTNVQCAKDNSNRSDEARCKAQNSSSLASAYRYCESERLRAQDRAQHLWNQMNEVTTPSATPK